jgi:hypothetical protein
MDCMPLQKICDIGTESISFPSQMRICAFHSQTITNWCNAQGFTGSQELP